MNLCFKIPSSPCLLLLVVTVSLTTVSSQQPLGLFGFEPYQIYEMPSYAEFGRKTFPDNIPPVRRHAKLDSSETLQFAGTIISSKIQRPELRDEKSIDGKTYIVMNLKSDQSMEQKMSKDFLDLISTSKVKNSARSRKSHMKKSKTRRLVTRKMNVSNDQNDSRKVTHKSPVTIRKVSTNHVKEPKTDNIRIKPINEKPIKKNASKKQYRKPLPLDKLAVEQFNQVISKAKELKIIDKNAGNVNEITIATPQGTYEEGSIIKLKLLKSGPNVSGFSVQIRRGPYQNSYHTQILNDYSQVSSLLGASADTSQVSPDIKSILDKISLKSDWEIRRL